MTAIAAMLCWLAGFALLWKMPRCTGAASGNGGVSLAIIIPARNEAENLPRLLASIAQQDWQPAQILVVDDESTDQTASLAKAAGATVIASKPLPDGWRGKTWACQQGADAAAADHLLFLDADTWFEPGGLRRIVEYYLGQPTVLSVLPYHLAPRWAEQLSAFFNLVMPAGVGAFTILPGQRIGLFGQMLLIDRRTYQQVGGHERVKQHVLENLHLAMHLKSQGTPLRCAAGRGNLSMRMYPGGLAEMVAGWSKGFARGAGATAGPLMMLIIIWLSGAVMAVTSLLRPHHLLGAGVYAMFVLQFYFMLRRLGSFRFLTSLLYPIPLLFFFLVFGKSVLTSPSRTVWKGRPIGAA